MSNSTADEYSSQAGDSSRLLDDLRDETPAAAGSARAVTTDWTRDAADRLLAGGYQEVPAGLSERNARAFRRRDFRLRWFATTLHTFVVLAEAPTAAGLGRYSDDAARWAKGAKGGLPRGMQTGIAVLPVLVVASADDEARLEAGRRPEKDFGAVRLPLLVEPGPGAVSTYSGTMLWGMIYTDFLSEQQRLLAGDLPLDALQAGGERRGLRWAAVGSIAGALVALVLVLAVLLLR